MPHPHRTETLTRLAALAALAPSSHNCQPWRLVGLSRQRFDSEMGPLRPAGEQDGQPLAAGATHTLLVCIDRQRALRALPTLEREMRMSVGGFSSLLVNLLRIAGFGVRVHWLTPGWTPATASGRARLGKDEAVMVLHLSGSPESAETMDHPLTHWIACRHTMRSPFADTPDRLGPAPRPGTCLPHRLGHHGRWKAVPHGPLLSRLAAFYREHAAEDFRHGTAWRETYNHLHFGGAANAAADGHGVGMAIEALFGPLPAWRRRLMQTVLHPQVLARIGPLGLHARIGRDFEQLVQHSAGVWALIQDDGGAAVDERRAHLLAGETVLDSWLAATRDGLSMQPLSVTLQHAPIELALRRLLGVDQPVLFIARVGMPVNASTPPRLRRATATFCQFDFSSPASAPTPAPVLPC